MVNIYQYLSSITYARYGTMSMLPTPESKICHGINLKKVRAGYLKEISQQFIGSPLIYQIRKVIKDVADPSSVFLNYSMHLTGEIVESGTRVNSYNR